MSAASRYHEVHARSVRDPEGFWAEAARAIDWIEPAKKIFDPSSGAYGRWFAGAVVNTCYNALDRHVAAGRGEQLALIHDSPLTNSVTRLTYAEMLKEVQTLAALSGTMAKAMPSLACPIAADRFMASTATRKPKIVIAVASDTPKMPSERCHALRPEAASPLWNVKYRVQVKNRKPWK